MKSATRLVRHLLLVFIIHSSATLHSKSTAAPHPLSRHPTIRRFELEGALSNHRRHHHHDDATSGVRSLLQLKATQRKLEVLEESIRCQIACAVEQTQKDADSMWTKKLDSALADARKQRDDMKQQLVIERKESSQRWENERKQLLAKAILQEAKLQKEIDVLNQKLKLLQTK